MTALWCHITSYDHKHNLIIYLRSRNCLLSSFQLFLENIPRAHAIPLPPPPPPSNSPKSPYRKILCKQNWTSNFGPIALHGGHHDAVKSTTTSLLPASFRAASNSPWNFKTNIIVRCNIGVTVLNIIVLLNSICHSILLQAQYCLLHPLR